MKTLLRSLRNRLFLMLLLLLVAFAVVSVVMNALFLERFYVYQNRNVLQRSRQQISQAVSRGEDVAPFIRTADRIDGIRVLIADSSLTITQSSFPMFADSGSARLPSELAQLAQTLQQQPQADSIYKLVSTPDLPSSEIALAARLPGDRYLILRKPLKAISESAAIANQFSLLVGASLVVAGGLFSSVFARRVVRPVVEMSRVARAMASLDFSRRVVVDSSDEIGSLGDSVNQMAERLNAAVQSMQQDLARRKQLVRDMSHELKTPIGVIKGYAEALRFGVSADPDRYCQIIAAECDRMDRMVGELLDLSSLESGGREPVIRRFKAEELIDALVRRFTPVAAKNGVVVATDVEDGLSLDGDLELLERGLGNFMTNALRHTPAGGRILVLARRSNDGVHLSVHNSGSSVAAQDLPRIWDVFYRADQSRSRESGGQGLGLAIAKAIAGMHGGTCAAGNETDGVTFEIILPSPIGSSH